MLLNVSLHSKHISGNHSYYSTFPFTLNVILNSWSSFPQNDIKNGQQKALNFAFNKEKAMNSKGCAEPENKSAAMYT